jgi:16S rRNA (adenine1518-N6/adenine1519-N6)-dimethyltransferase
VEYLYAQPKKSLGQNFLKSKAVVARMTQKADVKEGDIIVEIGPGKGILTKLLLEKGATVFAIEKDDLLFGLLEQELSIYIQKKKLFLIHADVLDVSIEKTLRVENIAHQPYKLIANIPYNITGEILRKFLEKDLQPSLIALLVQKEVAERITVKDGKESILSISIKVYGEPSYAFTVKRELFSPAPHVDSAVLMIKNISKKVFTEYQLNEATFFEILKKGFHHKRKKLPNNIPEIKTNEALSAYKDRRAETLSPLDWISITKKISKKD